MENKQAYRLVRSGKKSIRRDYSKVSGLLDLPNLVEIQTDSFEWFKNEGINEVFNEIYPISNHTGTMQVKFLNCEFGEPKFNVNDCKYYKVNYAAPIKATMQLEMVDPTSGEISEKTEEVFLGDFPLMTPSGTFVINGAERVIVSQIVRSPGAYYKESHDDKTNRDNYEGELIPSRGTWLEYMTDTKKVENLNLRILNTSVDRKRKLPFSIFFKTLGFGVNAENDSEQMFEYKAFRRFLAALGYKVNSKNDGEDTEYLNLYSDMYDAYFGESEFVKNTLQSDKTRTVNNAMLVIYENQRPGEPATIDGAINLINAKFFDSRRYDLTKAGRYKLGKKLGLYNRINGNRLAEDVYTVDGTKLFEKGAVVGKNEREIFENEMKKGAHTYAYPMNNKFVHVANYTVSLENKNSLLNRILAEDVVDTFGEIVVEKGTVLTNKEIDKIAEICNTVEIYGGICAQKVVVDKTNVSDVLNFGQRIYRIGRILKEDGSDFFYTSKSGEEEMIANGFVCDEDNLISDENVQNVINYVLTGRKATIYLVGNAVQVLHVYPEDSKTPVKVVAIDALCSQKSVVASDLFASFSYFLNIMENVGHDDDIDQLGNRRIRTIGELIQNQFRIGLSRMERVVKERMSISEVVNLTPKTLTNIRPLTAAIKEFFASSQLSQFMDQTNPLAELTNKRRISALGPGGLTRERAGFEVRDVHSSHYGRICPIETPEGPNIGLISNLTTYARVNEYGFIQTPYRVVDKDGNVTSETRYLSADEEINYVIAQANEVVDGKIVNENVVARYRGETIMAKRNTVEFVDVSPKQIVSVATACIPFLENDDANRALMGANMQRQAIPLLRPDAPYVGTGIEYRAAKDSGSGVVCENEGIVTYVDSSKVVLQLEDGSLQTYKLLKFDRSNQGTCINQVPIVKLGERVKKGDVIADGPSMDHGELALGQNVVVAFTTWNGYNYEDAIIMSERLVKDDVYTSVHIEEYDIECRETKLGPEEITRDIPNVGEDARRNLDANGIIVVGAEVKEGDILVGKVTPKGQSEASPEEKLLLAIFGEKSREVRDNSLRVPHGGAGIVHSVRIFKRGEAGVDLPPGVNKVVKVYIVQKRKISEGDKMAGRHGNKGVISRILPIEDMPYLPDGTPVDIMLNPLGVPSRMNIGQVLEIHLGMAAKKLGVKFATPVFDGISNADLKDIMAEAGMAEDGKTILYDGRTGEQFDERVSVGVMYMIKLAHMVDDKLHARSVGPYSLVTQQPLGGKAQNGGQRFGEMEVWALEAYGAAHTLQEILTVKSDDINGRTKTYEAIVKGTDVPTPGIPESFRVLKNELQALAIDVKLIDESGEEIDIKKVEGEELIEAPQIKDIVPEDYTEDEEEIDDTIDASEELEEDFNSDDEYED